MKPLTVPEPRQIAVVRNYDEFKNALRARADELHTSRISIDRIAGLADGHTAHLLAPVPIKHIGPVSFGPLLQAMGLMILIVEDAEQIARFASRAPLRAEGCVNAGDDMLARRRRSKHAKWRRNSEWGRVMRAKQILLQSDAKRSAIARKGGKARWRKPKVTAVRPAKRPRKQSTLMKSEK